MHVRFLAAMALTVAMCLIAAAVETPRSALQKTMERRFVRGAMMIQSQQLGEMGGGTIQLKVEINTLGHQRSTILKPLTLQGIVNFDDRKQWITIMPDERRAMIQPSPLSFRAPAKERMVLVDRNYELSFDKGTTIAGRQVLVIAAKPKANEMPRRRYFVDEETFMLLRLEVSEKPSSQVRMLDTLKIEFDSNADRKNLTINLSGYDIMRMGAPRSTNRDRARAELGFTPRKLGTLPYGFVVTDMQLIGEKDEAFLAYRLTDGLSNLTVYQIDGKKNSDLAQLPVPMMATAPDGTRVAVIGDAPDSVRRAIRDVFTRPTADRP